MEKKRTVITHPVMFEKRDRRIRKRIGLTLAPETVERLSKVISDGDAQNISRAIDYLCEFYESNKDALHVIFQDKALQSDFLKHCFSQAMPPSSILESLVKGWVQSRQRSN